MVEHPIGTLWIISVYFIDAITRIEIGECRQRRSDVTLRNDTRLIGKDHWRGRTTDHRYGALGIEFIVVDDNFIVVRVSVELSSNGVFISIDTTKNAREA